MQLSYARDPTGCLDPKPRRILFFFLGVAPQGMGQVRVLVHVLPGSSLGQCHMQSRWLAGRIIHVGDASFVQ